MECGKRKGGTGDSGHYFHFECIVELVMRAICEFGTYTKCPMCNEFFSGDALKRLADGLEESKEESYTYPVHDSIDDIVAMLRPMAKHEAN